MSKILIVSKTKMSNSNVCIGGIDLNKKTSVRLLDAKGFHWPVNACPYNMLEIWDIKYYKRYLRPLPHSEDICVRSLKKVNELPSYLSVFDMLLKMHIPICHGSIRNVFENKLKHTESGTLYISKDQVSKTSTCFWVCNRDIWRKDYKGKIRYHYNDGTRHYITYVGLESDPPEIIHCGTLVRLSLAHWWAPADSLEEERCYLQLSGWY
jgi:hypothetical protein